MKLDLEAMAKESGAVIRYEGFSAPVLDEYAFSQEELEAFARLIVERCAVEAEAVEDKQRHIGTCPASAWEQGTLDAAEAIRNLLED